MFHRPVPSYTSLIPNVITCVFEESWNGITRNHDTKSYNINKLGKIITGEIYNIFVNGYTYRVTGSENEICIAIKNDDEFFRYFVVFGINSHIKQKLKSIVDFYLKDAKYKTVIKNVFSEFFSSIEIISREEHRKRGLIKDKEENEFSENEDCLIS